MKPLAIDLFCGLGGWTDGLLAEGCDVVGFDIERHEYGDQKYPAQLVIQDVLTLHGCQFRNASLIVASPPCQEYSYMAMPWKRAKQIAAALRGSGEFPEGYTGSRTIPQLTALFDACFRIQREACEAAGRYIPMVVENVKGAQPWVGRAKANFGSFYLWGDVAMVGNRVVCGMQFGSGAKPMRARKFNPHGDNGPGGWFADSNSKNRGSKNDGGSWFNIGSPGQTETGRNPVHELAALKVPGFNFHEHEKTGLPGRSFQSAAVEGVKGSGGGGFGNYAEMKAAGRGSMNRQTSSHSHARKAASAQIAKIPLELSWYVARSYRPRIEATA